MIPAPAPPARKLWRTCDIKVVAFLLYSGFKVASFARENQRAYFEFDDNVQRRDAVLDFWNKKASVEPVLFLDSLNRARDMVSQALKA